MITKLVSFISALMILSLYTSSALGLGCESLRYFCGCTNPTTHNLVWLLDTTDKDFMNLEKARMPSTAYPWSIVVRQHDNPNNPTSCHPYAEDKKNAVNTCERWCAGWPSQISITNPATAMDY